MIKATDFTFAHPLRVRWAECDAQGIVFNVNYFLYFDIGLTEYLRALGYAGENTVDFFTVHAAADYKVSALFDDELEVMVRAARIGRTSITFEMAVMRDGALLTSGLMVYVHGTGDSGKQAAAVLPQAVVDKIMSFEKTPPTTNAMT